MAHINVPGLKFADMGKFASQPKTRNDIINQYPANDINGVFKINENAKALHPDYQKMVVSEIIDHQDAKSFILKKADGSAAAFFRAGQYLSVLLNINGSIVTRPYSISSSPMWAKEGKYAITVKQNPNGFAAPWILENWKVGDEVTVSAPEGTFYYEKFRDSENVIALAGGSGITPFLSMAYAVRDGLEDFNLTIIFGSRNKSSILFADELEKIAAECSKVKVVHVLSESKAKGYEQGFITAELIQKYAPEDYSIFMCGPEGMYKFVGAEVEKLGIDKKHYRRELLGVTKNVSDRADYPKEAIGKTYRLTVQIGADEYKTFVDAGETILAAIEKAGIAAPSRCRSGECGWCRSKLISGNVYMPQENEGRRWSDKEHNYIHPCATFALSDIVIDVPGCYMK